MDGPQRHFRSGQKAAGRGKPRHPVRREGEGEAVEQPDAADKSGGIVVLTDRNLERVGEGGKRQPLLDSPPFEFPHDAVLHANGNYYASDGYARAIWTVTPAGQVSALVQGAPLQSPQGLALDGKGNLLVADPHARSIFQVSTKGEVKVLTH